MYCVHYNLCCLQPFRERFPEGYFGQHIHPHSRVVQAWCCTWTVLWHIENNWVKPPRRCTQVSDRNGDSMVANERQCTAQLAVISFCTKLTICGQSWNSDYDYWRTPITLLMIRHICAHIVLHCIVYLILLFKQFNVCIKVCLVPRPSATVQFLITYMMQYLSDQNWMVTGQEASSKLNSLPGSALSHHHWWGKLKSDYLLMYAQ